MLCYKLEINMKNLLNVLIIILFSLPALSQEAEWFAKGSAAINSGNYDEAVKYFNNVIVKNPKSKDAIYNRGLAHLYNSKLDEALSDFSTAIGLDSNFTDALNNRGLVFYYNQQYDMALNDFDKAISLDKNFVEAKINRASTYIDMKRYEEAETDLKSAVKLKVKNPAAFQELARLYYKQKKFDEAIEFFTKTIKSGTKSSKIYYNRGNAYFNKNEYENAIKDYTAALKLDTTETDALNNRAMAYDKLGKVDLAIKDRKKLGKIAGNENLFIPVDSLKWATFTDSAKKFQIDLPSNWNKVENSSTSSTDMSISPFGIKSINESYPIGVRISYIKDMFKQYHVKGADSLMEFWKGSMAQNSKEYFKYNLLTQKSLKRGNKLVTINKVILQYKEDTYPLYIYEYIITGEDEILFAYLQSPEKQIDYFHLLFDKAIETLKLN